MARRSGRRNRKSGPKRVLLLHGRAPALREPDGQQLARVVPFVGGLGDVEPLVALQPDERGAEKGGRDLGEFGLADSSLPFEEERTLEPEGKEERRRESAVGDIPLSREFPKEFGNRGKSRRPGRGQAASSLWMKSRERRDG